MRAIDEDFFHNFPDRAFRKLLSDPRNLAEVVASAAPEIAPQFDFTRVETVPREFLMEDWREKESDLLFRVPFHDDEPASGRTATGVADRRAR